MKIAIVGCGNKKLEGRHEAQNLYISNYFDLKKKYAQQRCDEWFIVSAKYGIIKPEERIESYDVHIDDVEELEADLPQEVLDAEEVVLLAGKKYRAELRKNIPSSVSIHNPFSVTSGIGEQISWLKKNVDSSQKSIEEVL